MSMPGQVEPQLPRSSGSSALKIVLIILAIMLVVCGGLCAGCLVVAQRAGTAFKTTLEESLQSMQLAVVFGEAMQVVKENAAVAERLGEPIEAADEPGRGEWPYKRQGEGDLKPDGETLQFDVKGPKGKGIVTVLAKRDSEGLYRPVTITVMFEDASSIDVPPKVATSDEKPTPEKVD